MYLDNNDKIVGNIVLIDPYIHKQANLTRSVFLERVKYVKYLRTQVNNYYISFYITSLYEYNNLIKFYKLVNEGIFDFDNHKVFAIAVQPKLYNWFKTTSLEIIQKQISCWMASSYFFRPELRSIQKEQVYMPLFEEEMRIINLYYSEFQLPDFKALQELFFDLNDESIFTEVDKCNKKYIEVCNLFYGSNPPDFLTSPFDYEILPDWGVNSIHNFEFIQSYMNENDWKRIIYGNSEDDMHRSESIDELWYKWKHTFSTFDLRKNFVYSFYLDSIQTKNEEKAKPLREKISNSVKREVWQRDQGQCVECGSKEKLEYDHIIPHSKGGSNTIRNLQLLCEFCNRTKYNRI